MVSQDPGDIRFAQERARAKWAVERWADFPVDRHPRPLILTGPVVNPEKGFRTGNAKTAFIRGDIEVQGPVPDDVLVMLRDRGSSERHPGPEVAPLVLSAGTKAETTFSTDRGQCMFPAWRFHGEELLGLLWVLDPGIATSQWRPLEPPDQPAPSGSYVHRSFRSFRSRIEPDDHTLHFEFTGGSPDWVDYPASEIVESDQAVAVIPIELDHGPPGPRTAIGYGREVVVQLRSSFGERVLVNLDASPVAVVS